MSGGDLDILWQISWRLWITSPGSPLVVMENETLKQATLFSTVELLWAKINPPGRFGRVFSRALIDLRATRSLIVRKFFGSFDLL